MKVFISESDRQNAKSVALRNIARYLNIPEWDTKSNPELDVEIQKINVSSLNKIKHALRLYFSAYDEWFKFYEDKGEKELAKGIDYELTDSDREELHTLISKREATLKALQDEFDILQLNKFNQDEFGTNIEGILDQEK